MNFIGVDLHKKIITVCVMDQNRTVLARKTLYCDQPDQIVAFFRQFQPFKVVVEATANYHWLAWIPTEAFRANDLGPLTPAFPGSTRFRS